MAFLLWLFGIDGGSTEASFGWLNHLGHKGKETGEPK